jgi:hypothetical protein
MELGKGEGMAPMATIVADPSAVAVGPVPAAVTPDALDPVLAAVIPEPPGVMDLLALVVNAAGSGGLSGLDSEGALRVVEAVEVVRAWADSVSVAATAVLVAELEAEFSHLAPEGPSEWASKRFVRHCRSAGAREIQVATGLPISQCQRRVWLSVCEPERVGPVLDQMRLGRVSFARAAALTEATAHLDAGTAAAIAARVLRPLTGPGGVVLPGMAPLSQARFTARLRHQLVPHHGLVGQARRSYAEAVKARRLSAESNPDGTGSLLVTGDGSRITAAAGRVDRIARRLRNGGDERTLAQLRADVATDLLLRGWIPNDPTFAQLGRPPTATVHVVVSLATLLGMEAGVGQVPGWGSLPADQTRAAAFAAGSLWTRIVTDPLTGRALEATAGTYRVPAAMAQQVNTRDGTCRAPGCEIPANGNDLDHTIEWAPGNDSHGGTRGSGGVTAETNLASLHRGHHNLKTSGFWDSEQSPDGTLTWTTATGRKLTTYPYVYEHPDNLPVAGSHLEARLGRRLAPIINPVMPLPGEFNIFDHLDWSQALAPAKPAPPPHPWPPELTMDQLSAPVTAGALTTWYTEDEAPPPF